MQKVGHLGGGEGLVRRVTSEIYCSSTDIGWRDFENHCSVSDTIFAQLLNTLVLGGMAFVLRGFLLVKCATVQTKPPVYARPPVYSF